jgi:formate dehydrogenase subunit gamma
MHDAVPLPYPRPKNAGMRPSKEPGMWLRVFSPTARSKTLTIRHANGAIGQTDWTVWQLQLILAINSKGTHNMLDANGGGPEGVPDAERHNTIVMAICATHGNKPSALIEILHDVQGDLGCVPATIVPVIGEALNLSRAEVHGVVTFYHDFRREPAGQHVLKICRSEACQSMGAAELIDGVTRAFATELGSTSTDRTLTVEAVYCLGNCALAPAAMLDNKLMGRATTARIQAALAAGKSP